MSVMFPIDCSVPVKPKNSMVSESQVSGKGYFYPYLSVDREWGKKTLIFFFFFFCGTFTVYTLAHYATVYSYYLIQSSIHNAILTNNASSSELSPTLAALNPSNSS